MDKETIKNLAKDQKYISGIYNYCDRWCERCPFTSRCLNFTIVEEHFGDLEDRDEMNEAFWDKFSEMLHIAFSMVSDMAEREGVDLDSAGVESGGGANAEAGSPFETEGVVHMASHMAESYADEVDEWFDANAWRIQEKEAERKRGKNIKLVRAGAPSETVGLEDVVEVIQWHQHAILIKIQRAHESRREEENEPSGDFPSDADGSAKVALIGIDRSLSAWGEMLNHFPGSRNAVMKIIMLLDRLRTMVEHELPNARAFIRPGFDEIDRG